MKRYCAINEKIYINSDENFDFNSYNNVIYLNIIHLKQLLNIFYFKEYLNKIIYSSQKKLLNINNNINIFYLINKNILKKYLDFFEYDIL